MTGKNGLGLIIIFLQDFLPVNPFYTAILCNSKGFSLNDVSNRIQPYFFYGSLAMMILAYMIINTFGKYLPSAAMGMLQAVFTSFLITHHSKNLRVAQLIYGVSGANTSLKSIIRVYMLNTADPERSSIYQRILRYTSFSISSWLGQGIFNVTSNYDINIMISVFSNLIALVPTFVAFCKAMSQDGAPNSQTVKSPLTFITQIPRLYDRNSLIGSIVSGTGSCLQIYLSIFSQTLFHEKIEQGATGDGSALTIMDKLFLVVHVPIHYIALGIVRLFNVFRFNFPVQNSCFRRGRFSSGYIEGTIKLLASLVSLFAINCLYKDSLRKYNTCVLHFVLLGLSILCFIVLGICKSILICKLLYFSTMTLVIIVETIAKKPYYRSENLVLISCVNLLVFTLVHTMINILCKILHCKTSKKCAVYSIFALTMLFLSVGIHFSAPI